MTVEKKKIPKSDQYIRAILYTQGEEYLRSEDFKESYLNPNMCASCFSKSTNVLSIELQTRGRNMAFHCNIPICERCLNRLKKMKGYIGR